MELRQFSSPYWPIEERLVSAIVTTHAQATVGMLQEQRAAALRERSHGVDELLTRWCARTSDFACTWDLAFGRALRALESVEVDAVDVLTEVAVRLAATGMECRWSAHQSELRPLVWGGAWLLPAARDIAVASDGATAEVRLDGQSVTLRRTAGGWESAELERVQAVGARRSIALLPPEAVPRDMIVEDDFHSIFEFPAVDPAMAEPFDAALALLAERAPRYLEWVQRVCRGVLICRCQESRTRSSSWMHAPGIYLVSWTTSPVEIAEMLVHESTHQYYYLASRLGPAALDDGEMYYSPAVQRKRPLGKILVGYHAFANILLFYRELLAHGMAADPHCVAIESRLSGEIEDLERPLRDNPALTELGLQLSRPLMERLRSR